ncbi:MAG: NUDIX domain-containing protein [Gammaproteobacteria bacterium]
MEKKTLSAGVIVIRREENKKWYLLLRAYRNWDFPKGMVEAGEEPLQGAIREVEEETSLNNLTFTWGNSYQETPPYGRGKVARYYVAETRQANITLPVNPELGRPEHEEYRWVTYQEARGMVAPRVLSILDWAWTLTS